MISVAFAFQDSGPRTVFALALTTSLVAMIIMLSMVVITGYVGQISLAQMSLAGVAAFFMARMMAHGTTTSTNPFPVSGPGLPWPIASVLRHHRGDRRRRAARLAGRANPRGAARRGHDRRRHLAADAVLRERLAHRSQRRRPRQRSAPRRSSASSWPAPATGASSTARRSPSSCSSCWSSRAGRGQPPAQRHRPAVPGRAGQRAGRGGGRRQRVAHEAAGLRHRRRDRRDRRRDARVQAERRVVGQLRLPVEHRVPRLRLPRRHHLDQRRDHRRPARPGRR